MGGCKTQEKSKDVLCRTGDGEGVNKGKGGH